MTGLRKVLASCALAATVACTGCGAAPTALPPLDGCRPEDVALEAASNTPVTTRQALQAGLSADPEERWFRTTLARVDDALFHVPIPSDPEALVGAGTLSAGPLDTGLLICRVSADPVPGKRTVTDVRLALGDLPELVDLGSDGRAHFVTLPAARVQMGDRLRVHVTSRDEHCDWRWWTGGASCWDKRHGLATGDSVFDGRWPLTVNGPRFDVRCDALDAAELQARAASALATVDAGLQAACAAYESAASPVALQRVDASEIGRAQEQAAALVGYGDPSVVARSERWARIRDAVGARAERWTTEVAATAAGPGHGLKLDHVELSVLRGASCTGRHSSRG